MDESYLSVGRSKMEAVVKLISDDLLNLQTGRAKPAMVEHLKVEAYEGTVLELRELATITAPDPQTIVIQPWDQAIIDKVVKALQVSQLKLNPVADNNVIRLIIPSLTEERRQELIKALKQKIESGKAMLRQIRLELKKEIDDQKNTPGVSEDDIHQAYDQLQALIDDYNQRLESLERAKAEELLTI